jgi:hypothetical protein
MLQAKVSMFCWPAAHSAMLTPLPAEEDMWLPRPGQCPQPGFCVRTLLRVQPWQHPDITAKPELLLQGEQQRMSIKNATRFVTLIACQCKVTSAIVWPSQSCSMHRAMNANTYSDLMFCSCLLVPFLQSRTCGNTSPISKPNTPFTCPDTAEYDPSMGRVSPPK